MKYTKEQAIELVYEFINISPIDVPEWLAKRCALIAVDELINHCNFVNIQYWQEVKTEIELL